MRGVLTPGQKIGRFEVRAPVGKGGMGAVSARSDVHAVGAILFEMLAGRPAYDGTGVDLVLMREWVVREA